MSSASRSSPAASARARLERRLQVGRVDDERPPRRRRREDLERDFDEHAEPPQAADHQPREVEPGGVLDHAAAGADQRPGAVDEARPDDEVAHAAVAVAAGSGRPGGDDAAERRPARASGGSKGRCCPSRRARPARRAPASRQVR